MAAVSTAIWDREYQSHDVREAGPIAREPQFGVRLFEAIVASGKSLTAGAMSPLGLNDIYHMPSATCNEYHTARVGNLCRFAKTYEVSQTSQVSTAHNLPMSLTHMSGF